MAKHTAPKTKSSAPARAARASDIRELKRSEPTHDQIASRAFELYRTRGSEAGDALNDWLLAEAQLRGGA